MNWKIGPARCRSDEYEADVLKTDMGGERPILFRIRVKGEANWAAYTCDLNGRVSDSIPLGVDLLPPRLSLEEAARECAGVATSYVDLNCGWPTPATMRLIMLAALRHYETIRESVRDE